MKLNCLTINKVYDSIIKNEILVEFLFKIHIVQLYEA